MKLVFRSQRQSRSYKYMGLDQLLIHSPHKEGISERWLTEMTNEPLTHTHIAEVGQLQLSSNLGQEVRAIIRTKTRNLRQVMTCH